VIEALAFALGLVAGVGLRHWSAIPLSAALAALVALVQHTDTNRLFLVLYLAAIAAVAAGVAVIGMRRPPTRTRDR
jgi:hypothetical protein